MHVTRREVLASLGTLAASAALDRLDALAPGTPTRGPLLPSSVSDFPRKADFTIADDCSYINGAFSHPMPSAAAAAYHQAVAQRNTLDRGRMPFVYLNPPPDTKPMPIDPRAAFASLINAKPDGDQLHRQHQHWGEPGRRGARHHPLRRQCGHRCAALRWRARAPDGAQEAGSRPPSGEAASTVASTCRTWSAWWIKRPS